MEKRFLEVYNKKKIGIFLSCDVSKFSQLRFLIKTAVESGKTLLRYWTKEDSYLNINILEELYNLTEQTYRIFCEIGNVALTNECKIFDDESTLFDLIDESKYQGLDMDDLINPTKILYKAITLLDRFHREDLINMNMLGFSRYIYKPCETYTRFMINEVIMI